MPNWDWHFLFVGEQCLTGDHSISARHLAEFAPIESISFYEISKRQDEACQKVGSSEVIMDMKLSDVLAGKTG